MDAHRKPCLHRPLSPAVQLCCDARNTVIRESNANQPPSLDTLDPKDPRFEAKKFRLEVELRTHESSTIRKAEEAYRFAMPDPSTHHGVRDFIACVLHGMAIAVLSHNTGSSLLSGARVALAGTKPAAPAAARKAKMFSQEENDSQPAA